MRLHGDDIYRAALSQAMDGEITLHKSLTKIVSAISGAALTSFLFSPGEWAFAQDPKPAPRQEHGPRATPPSKPLLAFGDDRNWIVLLPLVYTIGKTAESIEVPAGFVTDLASIPKVLWGPPLFLTPTGQYSRASIIHDYLYWSQKCTRDQADRLLVIAMKESNVGSFDAVAIYEGVHNGGAQAWIDDANDRARGLPRIVPEAYRSRADPNMSWPTYADALMKAGVRTLDPVDQGSYCHLGDTTDVP